MRLDGRRKGGLAVTQAERIGIADAVLEHGRYSWVWVVPTCPYCGKRHEHYGGALDSDPYRYLGQPIASQCSKTDRRQLSPGDPTVRLQYLLESTATLVDETKNSTAEDVRLELS